MAAGEESSDPATAVWEREVAGFRVGVAQLPRREAPPWLDFVAMVELGALAARQPAEAGVE